MQVVLRQMSHRVIISRANIDEINEQILPLMMCNRRHS
jgi:hypothetical protein